ncbi:ribonuclease H2 subunit A [Toxorhynchites rutilus septentrionalis]|uniref:ribonuclease H2 subunit A n=1 Tax=Toxorhynchites rutilus septentrionalis TaxID=329112 RepID=UPI00247A9D8C|nr:ribonuclease H2 subunit A [Toxorhynchites rutilus septentrionalis]
MSSPEAERSPSGEPDCKRCKITSLESLGPYISSKDNAKNFTYISDVPQSCIDEPCVLGVDEAGRGPVLGPMVYGIAFSPISKKDVLKQLGFADSKQLTEEKRDIIFDNMNRKDFAIESIGWAVEVISPNQISMSMLRRTKRSLNEVSMDSAIGLIHRAIEAGANIAEVYVDTVGPPEKYQAKLKEIFPKFKIIVAKKADSTYPIVSAASICAKVSRDHALKVWKFREGQNPDVNFGSGYPGDPVTKAFLNDFDLVFGFPRLVRFSWSTAGKALEKKAYGMQFDDDDEEHDKQKATYGSEKLSKYFAADRKEQRKRHEYFRERCLKHVSDI